jgi:hypothetical protein
MSKLVVGNNLAFVRVQEPALLFESGQDAFDGPGKVLHRNRVRLSAGCHERGFIDDVG